MINFIFQKSFLSPSTTTPTTPCFLYFLWASANSSSPASHLCKMQARRHSTHSFLLHFFVQPNATVHPGHLPQKQLLNASEKSRWNLHNHFEELLPTSNQTIHQLSKSPLFGGRSPFGDSYHKSKHALNHLDSFELENMFYGKLCLLLHMFSLLWYFYY